MILLKMRIIYQRKVSYSVKPVYSHPMYITLTKIPDYEVIPLIIWSLHKKLKLNITENHHFIF